MASDRRMCLKALAASAGLCLLGTPLPAAEEGKGAVAEALRAATLREMRDRAELFKILVKKYGPGILDAVREYVEASTEARLRTADLPKRDLDAILEIIWVPSTGSLEWEIEKKTPEVLKLKVKKCVYAEEMRRRGAAEIGLAFYCAYDQGFCRGYNPDLAFSRTKTLMAGDDCCDHAYQLKAK